MVDHRASWTFRVGLLIAVLMTASPPTTEGKKRIPPCPGGVFLVDGEPLLSSSGLAVPDTVSVDSGSVSVLSGCGPTTVRLKGTRRGTKLKAKWTSCPGISGRLKLKARMDPSCASMTGKLRARKLKRSFTAHIRVARCGDGIVDPGEACDGEGTCGEGETCESCGCVADLSCGEASVCGGRRYCNEAHDCLCIRSAEGPILCGHRPATCSVQLCQTSADCAHLGEGYFCDTPNSGCCSDGELPRCIAPCERPACTPERICGDNCCPVGSGCAGGACCPTGRICGEVCCSEGEGCEDGKCALPGRCPGDDVTAASLLTADAALEAGATEVPLSTGGCATYRRTLDNGVLMSDALVEAGRVAVETSYTDTGTFGREDRNLDGVFDWEAVLTRGTDPEVLVVIHELDFQTGQEVRREERAVRGGTIHVVITQGSELVNEFDTTVEQPDGGVVTPAAAPGPCDDAHTKRYKDDLKRCMERTPKCLSQHGKDDVAAEMKKIHPTVTFLCGDIPDDSSGNPVYAQANAREASVGATRTITVNTTRESPSQDFRSSTLCHEVMHFTSLGLHDLGLTNTPRQFEADRVHACESLCGFAFPGTKPSKCQCASCLDSADCDPRCNNKGYRDCNPDMGALCLCPKRHIWYPTLTLCRQECPSGVACFGFSACAPLDRGCD